MDYLTIFGIIALAALIHASFQLSVSMVTLVSGHALGAKKSYQRTMRLVGGFVLGVLVMTILVLTFVSYVAASYLEGITPPIVWAAVCGLLVGLGVAVWAFYYRREQGTALWLPRGLAHFLADRTKSTKLSAESFSLGLTSVLAEGLFIIPTVTAAALALIQLPTHFQILGVIVYTLIATLPLLFTVAMIGSGHKISTIQRWREKNKRFLQFAAGSALIVLGAYIYANEVVAQLSTTGVV